MDDEVVALAFHNDIDMELVGLARRADEETVGLADVGADVHVFAMTHASFWQAMNATSEGSGCRLADGRHLPDSIVSCSIHAWMMSVITASRSLGVVCGQPVLRPACMSSMK